MDNYSSEIEIAIKIGEIKLTNTITGSWGTEEGKDFKKAIIALGVNLNKDAKTSNDLSKGLRALTIHRGDISYERFIQSIDWTNYREIYAISAFILGIGYIYPPSSLSDLISYVFNKYLPEKYNTSSSIIDLYDTARRLYTLSQEIKNK